MKPFRERNPILVGVISVGVLTVLMAFAFSLNRFTFFRGVYEVSADFEDAAGLTPENEVRVAGLKVGKVKSIELAVPDQRDVVDRVRIVMEIGSDIELGDASEAEIKLKTILGQKFVDIAPKGGAPFVRDDQIIPIERTRIPFELYEVTNRSVSSLGEIDAVALNDALRQLGTLFEDPDGNLGRALDGLSKATVGLKDKEKELEDLIVAGGEILEVLGSRSEALGRIFDSGSDLLRALSERGDSLRSFVRGTDKLARELGGLLKATRADLDPALEDLHEVLLVVKKDIGPLEKAVEALGPSAKSFGRAFLQGHWGDIWLQSVADLPIPPTPPLPVGLPLSGPASSTDAGSGDLVAIMLEASR
jgi:phospholipid/cholesterol/gamma-HCH transport system substrate-binding protein